MSDVINCNRLWRQIWMPLRSKLLRIMLQRNFTAFLGVILCIEALCYKRECLILVFVVCQNFKKIIEAF